MLLNHNLHLTYCTNVHPGESWAETLASLERWTLEIKRRLGHSPFGVGLRLSDLAARELSAPEQLLSFQRWLDRHGCYVFTINGFPFGQFHGGRVKERVYQPDWTDTRRLNYTKRLFDLLVKLVPAGVEGSVSTLPGSFKEFIESPDQTRRIRENIWQCVEHVERLSSETGRKIHLGLEPEPLGLFENSAETIAFFEQLRDEHPGDGRLNEHLGVNYDTCHFALEYEEPAAALAALGSRNIRLSKIHISNALALRPTERSLALLRAFQEDVYLHQVLIRDADGSIHRFKDLGPALGSDFALHPKDGAEWRVHFHVPLHSEPPPEFQTTSSHVVGLLQCLNAQPQLCSHLEMETYTWQVLPEPLKTRDVAEQVVGEYQWTLRRLEENGFRPEVRVID